MYPLSLLSNVLPAHQNTLWLCLVNVCHIVTVTVDLVLNRVSCDMHFVDCFFNGIGARLNVLGILYRNRPSSLVWLWEWANQGMDPKRHGLVAEYSDLETVHTKWQVQLFMALTVVSILELHRPVVAISALHLKKNKRQNHSVTFLY